jgi:hypothetical protein
VRGVPIFDPGSSDPLRVKVGEHDAREIEHFQRFLKVAPRPPARGAAFRELRGWVPYILGHFLWSGVWGPHERSLAPPPGYDDVPMTAWTMPGHDPPAPYRGGHYPHVEEVEGGFYVATCAPCYWRGEEKSSRSAAERDWRRKHR